MIAFISLVNSDPLFERPFFMNVKSYSPFNGAPLIFTYREKSKKQYWHNLILQTNQINQ